MEAFKAWGTNVVDYMAADGSDRVIVSVVVHDMDGMRASLASPEIDAAKRAMVIDPVVLYLAGD